MRKIQTKTSKLTTDIKNLISISQETAIRAVDTGRVILYCNIGKRIVEELQDGKDRADYGSGYSVRQLELMRQFYRIFLNTNAVYSQLKKNL